MPRSENTPSSQTAQKILTTAQELFYTQGIRAIGVEEIAKKSGTCKPILYRNYVSKDDLAAQCVHGFEAVFWKRFESALDQHPDNPRAGLIEFLERTRQRACLDGYRGCGMSNTAVEYPERDYPARHVVEQHKDAFRRRLVALAGQIGAHEPQALGDALMLLIEGAFVTGQIFADGGPAASLVEAANLLIDASLAAESAPV